MSIPMKAQEPKKYFQAAMQNTFFEKGPNLILHWYTKAYV